MKKILSKKAQSILVIFLLAINFPLFAQTPKLIFEYDGAGNQTMRRICYSNCDNAVYKNAITTKDEVVEENSIQNIEDAFTIYPNPTEGLVKLEWDSSIEDEIETIELVGNASLFYKEIEVKKSQNAIELDISNEFTGMYVFVITFQDGSQITKKLIKQ
jgi:hypothetical protein